MTRNGIYIAIIFMVSLSNSIEFENLSERKYASQICEFGGRYMNASKAVDGLIDQGWPNLAVTCFARFVWWYVDLGAPRNIHNITIYYRNIAFSSEYNVDFRLRFAGFSLFIANENFTTKGGHDCSVNSSYPPVIFPAVCMSVDRYVTVYNERPTAHYDTGAILELSEVQVFGCENPTTYGTDCNIHCPDKCRNNWCNIVNGSCYSCSDGYYGISCDQCSAGSFGQDCRHRCSWNCKNNDTCDFINGYCNQGCADGWTNSFCSTKCQTGYYGSQCSSTCSVHCKNGAVCDHVTGACDYGCKVDYYGSRCAEPCSGNCKNNSNCSQVDGVCSNGCKNGYYGSKCSMQCSGHCKQFTFCEDKTGSCMFGCEPGWKTEKCNTACDPGEYGENCANSCGNCTDGTTCNPVSGQCESGCEPGYTGILCKQACRYGLYGPNCSRNCSGKCLNFETCKVETGTCDNGCTAGYKGTTCDEVCEDGQYGQNCQITCGYCMGREVCDKMSGHCEKCISGYKPPLCTTLSQDLTIGVGIAVGIGTVITLIIASVIGCLIFRRRRNGNNTNTSQPTATKDTDATCGKKDPHRVTNTDVHDYQELGDFSNDFRLYEEIKTQRQ